MLILRMPSTFRWVTQGSLTPFKAETLRLSKADTIPLREGWWAKGCLGHDDRLKVIPQQLTISPWVFGPVIILSLLALNRHLPSMSLSTIPHTHLNHDDTNSLSLSSRHGHAQGRSMDVTASPLHRTSPLDLDFARIRPLIKSGTYLEPIDTNVRTSSDIQAVYPTTPSDPSTLRFSSNAGIIEHYSQSWNTKDTHGDRTQNDFA